MKLKKLDSYRVENVKGMDDFKRAVEAISTALTKGINWFKKTKTTTTNEQKTNTNKNKIGGEEMERKLWKC